MSAPAPRTQPFWLEYLVKCQEFDRTLPGSWSIVEPGTWLISGGFDRAAQFAGDLHQRVVRAVQRATGKTIDIAVESEVVAPLLRLTHDQRVELLAGRSPIEQSETEAAALERSDARPDDGEVAGKEAFMLGEMLGWLTGSR